MPPAEERWPLTSRLLREMITFRGKSFSDDAWELLEKIERVLASAPVGEAIMPEYTSDNWMFDTRGQTKHDRPVYQARLLLGPVLWQPETAESLLRELGHYGLDLSTSQLTDILKRAKRLLDGQGRE